MGVDGGATRAVSFTPHLLPKPTRQDGGSNLIAGDLVLNTASPRETWTRLPCASNESPRMSWSAGRRGPQIIPGVCRATLTRRIVAAGDNTTRDGGRDPDGSPPGRTTSGIL